MDAKALAVMFVTMANADGNDIAIDIEAVATLGIIRHKELTKSGKWIILKQS
ncbi:MAG: hypothetical protein ACTTKN_08035 [Phocaeicola sp.]|uniref:hypothetical protein n=1 Tax=Phocaeicola TaxID=909656 RepID=UPI00234EEE8D|nr:hypothetical protein [Phocaeicola oris]MCE2617128.1 hypothetical protein [Phocaeicola oris]